MNFGFIYAGLIGLFTSVPDAWGSIIQYRKQRLIELKNRKLVSCNWGYRFEHWLRNKKMPRGKMRYVVQDWYEHVVRLWRGTYVPLMSFALIGIGVML